MPPADCNVALLETKKAEWTVIQVDLASKAIFEDCGLSFEYSRRLAHAAVADDLETPQARWLDADGLEDAFTGLQTVAGLDVSFSKTVADEAVATIAVLSFPDLQLLHSLSRKIHLHAPYIPSFLSMREAEPLVDLINDLRTDPDKPFPQVFLVDGNGRMHERECGLATAVGVLADVPVIGCAKDYHPLLANADQMPAWRLTQKAFKATCKHVLHSKGDWMGMYGLGFKTYSGAAILSSPDKKARVPMFVSPGHRVSLNTSTALALACSSSARVPEPIRLADKLSRDHVKEL